MSLTTISTCRRTLLLLGSGRRGLAFLAPRALMAPRVLRDRPGQASQVRLDRLGLRGRLGQPEPGLRDQRDQLDLQAPAGRLVLLDRQDPQVLRDRQGLLVRQALKDPLDLTELQGLLDLPEQRDLLGQPELQVELALLAPQDRLGQLDRQALLVRKGLLVLLVLPGQPGPQDRPDLQGRQVLRDLMAERVPLGRQDPPALLDLQDPRVPRDHKAPQAHLEPLVLPEL